MARPNILFIQADQLAANALKTYGNKTVKAPNIDRLAQAGVVFDNCYCNLPMCGPSRASMHAGKLPFSIGMYDNASEFHADIPTFAHYLRSMDYRVEMSGKMHFVGPDQLHGYHKRHTTEIYPANFAWTVDWSKGREYKPTNLTMAPILESGPAVRTMQMDYDDEVEYHGIQALYDLARTGDDRPFMLTVSFTSPHSPFVIGQEYWDLYDHDEIEYPAAPPLELNEMDHLSRNLHYCQSRHEFTVTPEDRRMARHGYYGMISYIDDKVGHLVEVLEKTGQMENTIIILTADHGEMMGERGMWFKQHFFEWAASVPFIVYAPNRFKPARVKKNISLIDLLPTLTDLAADGAFQDFASPIDGQSLVPALNGDTSTLSDVAISEFAADGSTGPSRMVKKGPWKLMWLEGEDTLLYNIDEDPTEVRNRANDRDCTEIRAELETILFDGWNPEELKTTIRASQVRRLAIHNATGGDPTYVHTVRHDDGERYIRNAGAADTKARARLPYVAPAKPDRA
ncbi:choline-sulfatase [Ruegeria arenilitoris]|uniref:choline-sulfatase n=1 Tax=Ruegeria arenilitoris TaxID=1173585 RepID=UPI00147F24ED|nr:choline-sulfatase [Ruegeria arenilitoris]